METRTLGQAGLRGTCWLQGNSLAKDAALLSWAVPAPPPHRTQAGSKREGPGGQGAGPPERTRSVFPPPEAFSLPGNKEKKSIFYVGLNSWRRITSEITFSSLRRQRARINVQAGS